jgi:hypothetical protein
VVLSSLKMATTILEKKPGKTRTLPDITGHLLAFLADFGLYRYGPVLSVRINSRIVSTGYAAIRSLNFTGIGAFPSACHLNQVAREIGITPGVGGDAFGLPIICDSRTKPVSGRIWGVGCICPPKTYCVCGGLMQHFYREMLLL